MAEKADLVFEGGGVKGVGLAGAYTALEEAGWEPQCVAGTSAGAITAALVAAGYSGEELREEVLALKFREFKDEGWEDRVPESRDERERHRGRGAGARCARPRRIWGCRISFRT